MADLDAGADFAQRLRLLEHEHFNTLLTQSNRSGQSADATTGHKYTHGPPPSLDNLSDFT
jgi:hypothetical protein